MAGIVPPHRRCPDLVLCPRAGRGLTCLGPIQGAVHSPLRTSFHGTRLSELARLPFVSTVQEYIDRFNAILCHARDLSTPQKAELFTGGLPDHIRVDVELRNP